MGGNSSLPGFDTPDTMRQVHHTAGSTGDRPRDSLKSCRLVAETSMLLRHCSAAVAAVLACLFGLQPARADIYTWVDASGAVTISNLSPPEGARVISVAQEKPQEVLAREDAAREAARQAELRTLSDRIRQLESEVARPPAPPQAIYVPVPTPPQVVYAPLPAAVAPLVQYQANIALPISSGCDPSWAGCWNWWGSAFYPTSVVVVRTPNLHRHSPGRAKRHFPAHRPVRGQLRSHGVAATPAGLQWPRRTHRTP
jgi:hypothetical protein